MVILRNIGLNVCEQFFRSRLRAVDLSWVCELCIWIGCRGVAQLYSPWDRFPEGMICLLSLPYVPERTVGRPFPEAYCVWFSYMIMGSYETWYVHQSETLREQSTPEGGWLWAQRHGLDVDQVFLRCVVIYFCVCVCVCVKKTRKKRKGFYEIKKWVEIKWIQMHRS